MSLCTLEINLPVIKANYRLLKDICKTALVGAAVKANAYGLGAIEIAKALIEEDCQYFFVASSDEGISLRKIIGNNINILVLNGVFEHDALELIEYNLTPVLNNLKQIEIWQKFSTLNKIKSWDTKINLEKSKETVSRGAERTIVREHPRTYKDIVTNFGGSSSIPCYLHFNTGINRLGLLHYEIEQLINDPNLLKGLNVEYIISHLSASEDVDNPYNLEQLNKFKNYLGYFPNVKASLANSGGIFLGQDYHFNLVRPGAALYGLNPLTQNPVTLTASIIHLQNLTADSHIGYNMTFKTKRDSIIATLPLGYADGYSRNFSNQGKVFINGRSVPIVGRVSMDLVNIDVTDLPSSDIFLGQKVEIIGNYCTPDTIASIIGTIGYEILTSLGNRYKRVYTK